MIRKFISEAKYFARRNRDKPLTAIGALARFATGKGGLLPVGEEIQFSFRPYRAGVGGANIKLATPADAHYMHTYYDIDPISPSGKYLLVTRVPFIWRVPYPGDIAQVCIIDLEASTIRAVYSTYGWGTQLGANAQWGLDDRTVFCNDIRNGCGVGVRINTENLSCEYLQGAIFGLSPDRSYSYAPSIELINTAQTGYGVPQRIFGAKKSPRVPSDADGVWKTSLITGQSELLVSIKEIVAALPEQDHLYGGRYCITNVRVNAHSTRLLIALYIADVAGRYDAPSELVTCAMDGSDIKLAVPESLWRRGGHHANWCADGEHILMNLKPDDGGLGFYKFKADGADLKRVGTRKGGGHPSLSPSQKWIVTDSYVNEGFADSRGFVPIRLVDALSDREGEVCRVFTKKLTGGCRIDPHPAWSFGGRYVAINTVDADKRQVLLADVSAVSL